MKTVVMEQKRPTSVDDFDTIIEEVIAATEQMESYVLESDSTKDLAMRTVVEEPVATKSDDIKILVAECSPVATDEYVGPLSKVQESSVSPIYEDESMTIEEHLTIIPDGMMLPSLTSAEPTKIKFCSTIEIRGVEDGDWYMKNLPNIAPTDKGKKSLEEPDTIQGHPAREQFQLICGYTDFLILLRENVITEMNSFFHSFSLRTLNAMRTVKDILSKVEKMLSWAETDSLETAIHRRLFIIAKYREVLLRRFLVARRTNLVLVKEGYDRLVCKCIKCVSSNSSSLPARVSITDLSPICLFFKPEQCMDSEPSNVKSWGWYRVCTEVLRYSMFGCLTPVSSFNVCTDIVPVGPVLGVFSIPRRVVDDVSYHYLPPAVSESFNDLRTSMSSIISLQSKESRRLVDSHSKVLDKIKKLETTILDAFYQQNQEFHHLITGMRQEAHNDTNALSLGLKAVCTQTAILSTDQADRKEAKDQKAIIEDMDERLATLRSEQLDFCAQAQENNNNLSSQLGELVAYINRGNDKKGEGSSSRRPQPPPDDQNRPSGGNANRGGGGGGSGGSGRRDDRKGSASKTGSGSSGAGGPYRKNAEWWLYWKNQF
ncbi:Toll-Interleukin-Resistance domain-containing protein [Dorcoceras hygrometricum]|uniref:Toll-Interleukin-Resistance domain-containing protein n=1 Tax=Dorcoceras hygrometricum TaxID=472368 RepID=A0A2Z7BX38_9LAMI|nr:Toll-Interleukin-Resistance domain-containing protein [Dorcoceras hygrometricum]